MDEEVVNGLCVRYLWFFWVDTFFLDILFAFYLGTIGVIVMTMIITMMMTVNNIDDLLNRTNFKLTFHRL